MWGPNFDEQHHINLGTVLHTWKSSSWEVETGRTGAQSHFHTQGVQDQSGWLEAMSWKKGRDVGKEEKKKRRKGEKEESGKENKKNKLGKKIFRGNPWITIVSGKSHYFLKTFYFTTCTYFLLCAPWCLFSQEAHLDLKRWFYNNWILTQN